MSATVTSAREIYLKIVEHSLLSNHFVTLALKDNYRQSGQVKDVKISFAKEGAGIDGIITFYDGFEYKFSEIADIYT